MNGEPRITGAVHQNLYLAEGERGVHAVITVDSVGELGQVPGAAQEAAEVLIVDMSASMRSPQEKRVKTVEAAGVAIDGLRDGTWFAVVGGHGEAKMVWPREPILRRADGVTREQAKRALRSMVFGEGTRMGTWLRMAHQLLAPHPAAIRHAILLTDGKNEFETPEELDEAIAYCGGGFTCDCRGVGTNWSPTELRKVAKGLLGSVDVVAEPAGLVEDFRAMMAASMGRRMAEVALRLWTPTGAEVRLVTQTAPNPVDLTERRVAAAEQVGHYPTGSWGAERRDFQVNIDVPPGGIGKERLAGRVSFVALLPDGSEETLPQSFRRTRPDGSREQHAEGLISAIWTDSIVETTHRNPYVTRAEQESAMADAVRKGVEAARAHDIEGATSFLREARKLADACGDGDLRARIDQLLDPATDTFQLGRLTPVREIQLEMETDRRRPLERIDDPPEEEKDQR